LLILPFFAVFFVISIHNIRTLWLITAFLVPVSINLSDFVEGAALRAPTDALCIVLCLLTLFKILSEGNLRIGFGKHPIFMIIFLWMFWQFIAAILSEMPWVSLKRDLSFSWML